MDAEEDADIKEHVEKTTGSEVIYINIAKHMLSRTKIDSQKDEQVVEKIITEQQAYPHLRTKEDTGDDGKTLLLWKEIFAVV